MDEGLGDECVEAFAGFGPFIEQAAAVEAARLDRAALRFAISSATGLGGSQPPVIVGGAPLAPIPGLNLDLSAGSLLLFIALAFVMYATRRIDRSGAASREAVSPA